MQLDLRASAGSPRERRVHGHERRTQGLGERHVGGVVWGDVLAQLPDAGTQWYVRVAGGAEIVESAKSTPRPWLGEGTAQRVAADRRDHLEIEDMGHVQRFPGPRNTLAQLRSRSRQRKQDLGCCGGV